MTHIRSKNGLAKIGLAKIVKSGWPKRDWPKSVPSPEHTLGCCCVGLLVLVPFAPDPPADPALDHPPFFWRTNGLTAKHEVETRDTESSDRRATPYGGHP